MATTSPSLRPPRHRPLTRACDRCRRRKARCEVTGSLICSNCRIAGEECTFDLPLARRGPKAKRQKAQIQPITSLGHAAAPAPAPTPSPAASAPARPEIPPNAGLGLSGSVDSWESGPDLSLPSVVDPGLSPRTSLSHSHSPITDSVSSTRTISALQRWHSLTRSLQLRDPGALLERTVNRCFDFFFEYLFPLTPLVHEPSLREGLNFFVSSSTRPAEAPSGSEIWPSPVYGNSTEDAAAEADSNVLDRGNSSKYPELWLDSTFTLITAVCAEAAFLLPKEIFTEGEKVAEIFLQASRNCLNSYLEADLEYPNANSVTIRYFHSNCVHAAGNPHFSWHIFGEATRLAQFMQMHEEKSLTKLSPLEAELRRRVFWIVYIGDKSASLLNNRPITIHKFSFESGITTAFPTGFEGESFVSPGQAASTTTAAVTAARKSFIAGFNANLRLWQAAADLILEMRLLESHSEAPLIGHRLFSTEERTRLDQLYVLFMTSLDDLPSYLQTDVFAVASNQESMQVKQYILQCANLYISYHCLKMVIIQKFEDLKYFVSTTDHSDVFLLRKTEVARDMLRIIREAPFWSLQVNGEPCVEKIRLIGASLLEIIDRGEPSPLFVRARKDLSALLDILSRLDSRASDTLRRVS